MPCFGMVMLGVAALNAALNAACMGGAALRLIGGAGEML